MSHGQTDLMLSIDLRIIFEISIKLLICKLTMQKL